MTDEQPRVEPTPEAPDIIDADAPVQYGVGPFSIREVALGGVWVIAFLVSFFSLSTIGFASVWTSGLLWVLTIGAPTVAVFLLALRRLSPEGIRRFGSLGIDQFASVAFSVSAIIWVQLTWETIAVAVQTGMVVRSWVLWVELVLALAGVVLTVVAPHLPVLGDDFDHRPEQPAHRAARAARPIAPRPAPVVSTTVGASHPVSAAATPEDATDTAVLSDVRASTDELQVIEDLIAEPSAAAPRQEAFWVIAPEERVVHDEYGAPLFSIGPTAWALVIEDRGELFVIRHEDGRVGYLHDVSGVSRG